MNKAYNSLLIIGLLFIAACSAPKKTIYFRDRLPNDTLTSLHAAIDRQESAIQHDDILAINVTSISSSAATQNPVSIFNEGGTQYALTAVSAGNVQASQGAGGTSSTNSYLVDLNGYIDYPVLGKIKVAGLSIRQIKEMLASQIVKYIREPVVDVRILNYKVTVLGEVGHQGPVIAPSSKLSVLDAIAASGDIPITGRKDNVLVIREKDGQREFARLNLNSTEVFSSPYFYLNQNDIVYVEPNRIRRQETNTFLRFYLPTFTTLLGTAFSVYGIVQISNNSK